ncbi:hypothetical protein OHA40_09930 [Nocardia sp. NBC_00508]|uniref:hypothetical protein n=1 Tax=Nocardia sp. NBC_00508 TaxID=2975992 RepID=UPI002E819287|nr:hypothetical protein [Nocardia sp. NBC_00508]WUD68389.1 hypothetical protein OHA40_09930 [Nocardia sp. NBC_00508]
MSNVADHTALTSFAETPIFGQVLVDDYVRDRRFLAVPTVSLMEATRAADTSSGELADLLRRRVVIKVVDLDAELAVRIGSHIPVTGAQADWPLVAPVVWVARSLDIGVLTSQPRLYNGYGVRVVPVL